LRWRFRATLLVSAGQWKKATLGAVIGGEDQS
jgi:hypothetical protein